MPGASGKYLEWLWRSSKGARSAILSNVLLGFAVVGLHLLFIWLSKRLVDMASGDLSMAPGESLYGNLVLFASLLAGTMLLRILISAYNSRLENLTYSRMNFIIRQRLFSGLLQSQWQGKEKMHSGDTLNRLFTDVDSVTRVICQELPSFMTTLFQLIAAVAFLCFMDYRLALVLLMITSVFLAFSKVFFRSMRRLTRDIRNTESMVQSHIQESLQHKTLIQSLEQNTRIEEQLGELQRNEFGQVLKRTRFNIFARSLVSLTMGAGYVAALLWGVFGLSEGTVTFGILTAFLQLVGQIQGPAVGLTRQLPSFIYAAASIDRLIEIEDAPKEEKGEPVKLASPAGIRISKVSFRYPDGDSDILHDFSYDFTPGSRIAVEGETGVGKSTLMKLMLSLLKPDSGTIEVYDGISSVPVSPRTRVNMVYVPQGNTLFSGTVRDNLLMGDPDADEERMWVALETAAAGFVRELPEGLDTMCGEHGAGLSEGQSQRIAIARGLLRPGSIMLLDEFSSSLDELTEERLMRNLTSGGAVGKTMIFITHRPRISEYCDKTLIL